MEEELKYTSKFNGEDTDSILEGAKKVINAELPSLDEIGGFMVYDKEGKAIGLMSSEQVSKVERKLMKEEENIFYNKTFDKEYIEKVGLLVSGIKTSINSIELTDEEAVKYNYLLPSFDELVGKTVFSNNKFVCNGSVYSVNTSHTVDSSMKPTDGESTPMLLSAKNSSESESNYYRLISKI